MREASNTASRGSRLEILGYARFVLIPVIGLIALVGFPLGFFVGLVRPGWGYAIWDGLNASVDWLYL